MPIRVIIADDHEIFLDGLKVLLRKIADIEVVGEANNGNELINITKGLKPDVIITDIKMPVKDGIQATRILSKEFPDIGIIALSMFDEENLIVEMLEAGAKGYLLKNAQKHEIENAITSVYHNNTYYCARTSSKLLQLIVNSKYNPHKKVQKPQLTDKEIQIIQLICKEKANKEIADEMALSVRTVEGYRERIEEKVNAKNTAGIVVFAIKNGLHII